MSYKVTKLDGQDFMFRVETDTQEVLTIVCAGEQDDLDALIVSALEAKNNPQPFIPPVPAKGVHEIIQEQQAIIEQLKADVAALKSAA